MVTAPQTEKRQLLKSRPLFGILSDSLERRWHSVHRSRIRMASSIERATRKAHLWRRAMFHFSICFLMGFFTGFMPTDRASVSDHQTDSSKSRPFPDRSSSFVINIEQHATHNRPARGMAVEQKPRKLVIAITPTIGGNGYTEPLLRKLADTLSLISPPLLWIVVGERSESAGMSGVLRKTKIMYRHLLSKENITEDEAAVDHQRNIALNHIQHHQINGIVHFSELSNVYDPMFFEDIRNVEGYGFRPVALVSADGKEVMIEGPDCDSTEAVEWSLKKTKNTNGDVARTSPHVSSFAFNSSILWDPEKWGRRTSSSDATKQDSIRFLKREIAMAETNIKGIPQEFCSRVLHWQWRPPPPAAPNASRNPPK